MFEVSHKALTLARAVKYYRTEYSVGDYYAEKPEVPTWWTGKGLENINIEAGASVDREDFEAILQGKAGKDGPILVPPSPTGILVERAMEHAKSGDWPEAIRILENRKGKLVDVFEKAIELARKGNTTEALKSLENWQAKHAHRAGWDFVCSPDKSISIMGLVGGDKRIVEAVRAANFKALSELERFVKAKDKDRVFETTNNFIAATFEHYTSRKLDPQIHLHNVVMNQTRRADGKIVAIETGELYAAQTYATAVFRADLAKSLQQLGYEIEIGKDGNVSLPQISKDLCDWFSKRRKQDIEPYLAKHNLSGAAAAQKAATDTRKPKQHDVDEPALFQSWKDISKEMGTDVGLLCAEAESRARLVEIPKNPRVASRSLQWAMAHLSERKSIFVGRELMTEALKHGMGETTIDDLREAAKIEKDLIHVEDPGVPSGRMSTSYALEMEMRIIKFMRDGLGKSTPVLPGTFEPGKPLDAGQRSVAEHVLFSQDRVIAVEGKAGAGKTYTLESVVAAALVSGATSDGWEVRGFAPTSSAAQTLNQVGAECKTIASLLQEKNVSKGGKQLWIVDEAGLMSSKECDGLFKKAAEAGAKVVLVGDCLQHSAVGAGKPFSFLQTAGLRAIRLDDIQRQIRPAIAIHKAAVAAMWGQWGKALSILEARKGSPIPEMEVVIDHLKAGRNSEAISILEARSRDAEALEIAAKEASEGRPDIAVELLIEAGKVHEISNATARHRAVAQDFMATPPGQTCIVVAPSNAERQQLNHLIREELIEAGRVERSSYEATVRNSKRLTEAQKSDARFYENGDFIRFVSKSEKYNIPKGAVGRVVGHDREQNLVRVELATGEVVEYPAHRYKGGETANLGTRRFAVGDRVQYREVTRPDGEKVQGLRIVNGAIGVIRAIDKATGKAQVEVQMDPGTVTVEMDFSRPQPVDHAYALTSHASQGQTKDRTLLVVNTKLGALLVNEEQFYVSLTRAALEGVVYTNDIAALPEVVKRKTGKTSAIELKPEVLHALEIPSLPNLTLPALDPRPVSGHELGRGEAFPFSAASGKSVFEFADWPGDWKWWEDGEDIDLPGRDLAAPGLGDHRVAGPTLGDLQNVVPGVSGQQNLYHGPRDRLPNIPLAGGVESPSIFDEFTGSTYGMGGSTPDISQLVESGGAHQCQRLQGHDKALESLLDVRRTPAPELEPMGGAGSEPGSPETPTLAAPPITGGGDHPREPLPPGWDNKGGDPGERTGSSPASQVPSGADLQPSRGRETPIAGAPAWVTRLTQFAGALGFEIQLHQDLRPEDLPEVARAVVDAEWPQAPEPHQVARAALVTTLVTQDLTPQDIQVVATTLQKTPISPDPASPREVMVYPPKEAPVRGQALLLSAWEQVRSQWGGRVPPTEIPDAADPNGLYLEVETNPVPDGGAVQDMDRLVQLAEALGYEVERPGPGEEAAIVPVVVRWLVEAEWPAERESARIARGALIRDLVAQPIDRDEIQDLAKVLQAMVVEPTPSKPAEISIRVPPDRPSIPRRGWNLLASAWQRVQMLWGGRVPPNPSKSAPEPQRPTPPSIKVEEFSKSHPLLPDGWSSPEQRAAMRAKKVAAPKPLETMLQKPSSPKIKR